MLVDKTILIFGSGGFIGRELVAKLMAEGNILLLATRKDISESMPLIKYVKTDILLSKTPEALEILKKVDIVINCAGEVSDENKMYETNVLFVKQLIDMIEFAAIPRFIHLGSAGIYKKTATITVFSDIFPDNYYEKTKWEADQLILAYKGNVKMQIIRPTTVIGQKMGNQSFIQLLRLYKKVGFITVANPYSSYFHYVPVETVVEAIIMCIQSTVQTPICLVATDLPQIEFLECLQSKIKRIHIPYILLVPLALLKISGLTFARLRHLHDRSKFFSNIEKFNDINYKQEVLKRVIKSFDIL
jgi:nucleoside-diphosphate-sugar epimerase